MEKNIGWLNISVNYTVLMNYIKSTKYVKSNFPDKFLLDSDFILNVIPYFGLNGRISTDKSPSLAKSITTHKLYVFSS